MLHGYVRNITKAVSDACSVSLHSGLPAVPLVPRRFSAGRLVMAYYGQCIFTCNALTDEQMILSLC
jgi:hypothetical protein